MQAVRISSADRVTVAPKRSMNYHGTRSQFKGSPQGRGPTVGGLLPLASNCLCRAQELRDARPQMASPNPSEGIIEMAHRADCPRIFPWTVVLCPETSNIQGIIS